MGIAAPLAAAQSGTLLTIIVTGDDLSYNGQARFEYSLDSGGKTVMTDSVTGPVYPAIWLAVFPITAPAPGQYVLQGAIRRGQNTTSVVIAHLVVF